MNLFRSLAELLFDHLIPEGKNLPLQTEVDELASHKRGSVREYYIRKLTSVLMILTLTGLLAFITFLLTGRQDRSLPQSRLSRPGYGENDMDTSLSLSVSGMKESEDLDIHVSPRKYDKKEVAHLLKKAETQLKQELPGDNSSLEEIRSPLCFPENLVNGTVRAEYTVLPPDILDDDGAIIGQVSEDGTPVSIEAELHLQNQTRTVKYGAIVFPPLLTEEEAFRKELDHALLQADTEDPTAEFISLPDEAGGKKLSWKKPKSPLPMLLLVFSLLLPLIFWIQKDEEVRQEALNRRERLELDYSELLFKLTLLLGAGLTIKGAFARICSQYEVSSSFSLHPVYGEIRYMLREISGGVPQETAYENFGRRCGLPQYIKLGSLLAQNLRKGARGLTALLEKEAFLSLQQHRQAARKMGEKASMKMLFPMILMFIDVIIILMVPALLSM